MWWLITLHLILVHSPGGEEIHVNIEEISSIREPHGADTGGLMSENVHCIIGMTNSKFISTGETCKQIIIKLAEYDKMEKQEAEERLKHALHDDL